ncbi:MAG: EscU/YscU/HrcU family type III secretion system export apparatus switch protein [Spirochaetes bacterium]|nr:EscU/YscU/HrcU family type III secretion system export apparatus switch protein [Spirochaetota bacterium]
MKRIQDAALRRGAGRPGGGWETGRAGSPSFIHLQWFSDAGGDADDPASGKTEQPTDHKLRKLREEGQIAKSQELIGAISLFLPALLILFMAPFMLRVCVEMLRFFYLRAVELDPTMDRQIVLNVFRYFAILALPILAVAVVGAIFSNMIQVGFMFATKPITPEFSKVVPRFGQYFKRIFSVEGIYNFLKSIFKMLIVGGVAYSQIRGEFETLVNLQRAGLWLGITTVSWIAIRMMIIVALLLVVLAIPDYLFQRWRFRERNKMARHEIKEEFKQYEGDPQIAGRIRSRFRDLLRQNVAAVVPKADVVITNPTHLAIALEYDGVNPDGPMISAIGADELAARIRKIAEASGVPIVENKPLAWMLYDNAKVGDIIPPQCMAAVANVFISVMGINEARRKKAAEEAARAADEAASAGEDL